MLEVKIALVPFDLPAFQLRTSFPLNRKRAARSATPGGIYQLRACSASAALPGLPPTGPPRSRTPEPPAGQIP